MKLLVVERTVLALSFVLLALSPGLAQTTTGTILGSLVDQTGGVLPDVKVRVTSVDTGDVRETVTNGQGQYTMTLPIGRYEVTFLLPNFQPFTARGISLHFNDRLQVNGKLMAGAVETLTVTAERLVQPTPAVQNLVQETAIQELPLLTRTPIQLVTLVPGVSSDLREDACFCDQGNLDITVNGARRSAVNWLLDGASNVNVYNNYTLVTTPSLDAIQEISVITSTYGAEWARNGGGLVNIVTKSGTKQFSGSAYDYWRNNALNANSFFRNLSPSSQINSQPPRLRYHNFGVTLGGPALPNRKKLFFFFSGEGRLSSRNILTSSLSVPDPQWLIDPGSPNYVPVEARDPNAVKLLSLWPAPNQGGTNLYRLTGIANRLNTHQEFIRVDSTLTPNWSLAGRYLHDRLDSHGDYLTPDLEAGHRFASGHLSTIELRHVRGAALFELSYQISRNEIARDDRRPTRAELGIAIPELFPENAAHLVPTINVIGLSLRQWSQPYPREYVNQTISSAMTFQLGGHTLKGGGLLAAERSNSNTIPRDTQGAFTFQTGGGFTAFQNFLRGNASGVCGNACRYTETDTDVIDRLDFGRYEAYFQDSWRIHPKVTVDLGIRYSYYPPLTDENDKLFAFVPGEYDPALAPDFVDPDGYYVAPGTGDRFNGLRIAGQNSPYGRALYAADTNNVQPRAGLAWTPDGSGHTVIRSGYGMYFDQSQVGMFGQNVQESLFYTDPFSTDTFTYNVRLSQPALSGINQPDGVITPQVFSTSDPFQAPRWQHWNVGVQRRVFARGTIDVSYVGARGDHLLRYLDINQPPVDAQGKPANLVRPFKGYDAIITREPSAVSRYHGLLSSFQFLAGQGLSATFNYTLSRNNADASFDNSNLDDPQNVLDKNGEYGPARTDRTHILNFYYVYELPLARNADGWKKGVLQGWQVAGITRMESGPAARIQVSNCRYANSCGSPLRPNLVGDPSPGEQGNLLWLDQTAFVPPPPGEYGTAPVSVFHLPGRHQWDVTVSKAFTLTGTSRLQFRADMINIFNQTQFLDVFTSCSGSGTTCAAANSGFGKITSSRPPREIQLGLRLDW